MAAGSEHTDLIMELRTKYPKEWIIVSAPGGSKKIAEKVLRKRARQVGVLEEFEDLEELLRVYLETLNSKPPIKPSTTPKKRSRLWSVLRTAIVDGNVGGGERHLGSEYNVVGRGGLFCRDGGEIFDGRKVVEYSMDREQVLFRCVVFEEGGVDRKDLVSHREGVDNTGNVRVWPAEEILAGFCCGVDWKGIRVCEVGAGMGGHVGFVIHALGGKVLITDGNEKATEKLQLSAQLNGLESCVCCYRWGEEEGLEGEFDVFVGADALFFEEYHDALIQTLQNHLTDNPHFSLINSPQATLQEIVTSFNAKLAIFLAPSRGGSLFRFIQRCTEKFPFVVQVFCEYEDKWKPVDPESTLDSKDNAERFLLVCSKTK